MFVYWDVYDYMYFAINFLLILFLNVYMKLKFYNLAKNVDNFFNLMGYRFCIKKDCGSREYLFIMFI